MPTYSWDDNKLTDTVEVQYGGVSVKFEPGERATGVIALQMLIQSGLIPDIASSDSDPTSNGASSSSSSAMALPSPPTSPVLPGSPSFNRDLVVLDHGCSLGSCTHLLAALNKVNLVPLPLGGQLKLTAVETPNDFRHSQSKGLDWKIKLYGYDDVRLLSGQMHSLPFLGPHFTHILTNLSILFCASDDEPLHEIYRCLLPKGIVTFSSWKSLGWAPAIGDDSGPFGDPLKVYPSNGWRDPEYIRKKLTVHGFDNINIVEYPFQNKATPEVFAAVADELVRHSVGRLWNAENNDIMDQNDIDDIADNIIQQHQGRSFTGQMIAWITTARKPPLS